MRTTALSQVEPTHEGTILSQSRNVVGSGGGSTAEPSSTLLFGSGIAG